MQTLLRDFRYALRQLRRAPGFAVTVVLTLALGIGATTAIFSCVYSLLLKSLPFRDEGSIVALAETNSGVKGGLEATYPDYLDWRAQQKSFDQVAAPAAEAGNGSMDHRSSLLLAGRRTASITAELSLSGPSSAIARRSRPACAAVTGRSSP